MTSSLHLFHRISSMLSEFLPPLYKRRHDNLAWLMTGLHEAQHVHLSKIADYRVGTATLPSKTRQLRRFLANDAIKPQRLYRRQARRLLRQAARQHDRLRLLLDVVELSGERKILMLALAYRRRALPLLWHVWRGKGTTSAAKARSESGGDRSALVTSSLDQRRTGARGPRALLLKNCPVASGDC